MAQTELNSSHLLIFIEVCLQAVQLGAFFAHLIETDGGNQAEL